MIQSNRRNGFETKPDNHPFGVQAMSIEAPNEPTSGIPVFPGKVVVLGADPYVPAAVLMDRDVQPRIIRGAMASSVRSDTVPTPNISIVLKLRTFLMSYDK
jgi:hypothetical protein